MQEVAPERVWLQNKPGIKDKHVCDSIEERYYIWKILKCTVEALAMQGYSFCEVSKRSCSSTQQSTTKMPILVTYCIFWVLQFLHQLFQLTQSRWWMCYDCRYYQWSKQPTWNGQKLFLSKSTHISFRRRIYSSFLLRMNWDSIIITIFHNWSC